MNNSSWSNDTATSVASWNVVSPIVSSLTGIIGNVIALRVLWARAPQPQSAFYVLVAALACADLLGIVLTTWPVLVAYASGGRWPRALCAYHAFAMIGASLVTPLVVATMAAERWLALHRAYAYGRLVGGGRRLRLWLAVEGLVAVAVAALPLLGFGHYELQGSRTWCFLDLHPRRPPDVAFAVLYATIQLALATFIAVCNVVVVGTLLQMRKRRRSRGCAADDGGVRREVELQMAALLVAITVVFAVCWTPLMFQILINALGDHHGDHYAELVTVRLASINQILDPWIYILFRKLVFPHCQRCRSCFHRATLSPVVALESSVSGQDVAENVKMQTFDERTTTGDEGTFLDHNVLKH